MRYSPCVCNPKSRLVNICWCFTVEKKKQNTHKSYCILFGNVHLYSIWINNSIMIIAQWSRSQSENSYTGKVTIQVNYASLKCSSFSSSTTECIRWSTRGETYDVWDMCSVSVPECPWFHLSSQIKNKKIMYCTSFTVSRAASTISRVPADPIDSLSSYQADSKLYLARIHSGRFASRGRRAIALH